MSEEQLRALLDKALGALADIGLSEDVTLAVVQRKAMRIYAEIREVYRDG